MQQSSAVPDSRGVGRILVAGVDAESFLQGQLTQDVRRLVPGARLLAGYCSPKGRLLATMQMARTPDGIVLEIHRGVLDATLKRLRMFVVRSKVTMTALPDLVAEDDDATWRMEQIARGVPTIFPATSDHFVPQMCNLDQLGAISLDKGCYTGQEIVARLHYLGQVKRRMYRAEIAAPAAPGQDVFEAGNAQAVGELVDAVDGTALLVVQTAHASAALRLGTPDGPAIRGLTGLATS
jgi:folate-binding protein YgfZ